MKTLQELNNMTDDQLRVMLAELLGAKWYRSGIAKLLMFFEKPANPMFKEVPFLPKPMLDHAVMNGGTDGIPNYPGCLNACHEAEKTLNEGQRRTYFFHLFKTQRLDDGDLWKAVHATARQRTIALISTLQPQT